MLSIGIDWADEKHDVCIRDLEDRRILAEFTITHDAKGVKQIDQMVADVGFGLTDCLVAVETRHGLLVGYLLQKGYTVYALSPVVVKRYRQRASAARTDQTDAATLADILCLDRDEYSPIPADSPLAQQIGLTSRHRQKLVQEQTRLKNQLTACLKNYYPAALGLFSGLERGITGAFLRAYPNAERAHQASLAELEAFFREQGYTCKRRIPEIHARLQAEAIPVAKWLAETQQQYMLVLVDLLGTVTRAIQEHEQILSRLLDEHEDSFIFRSLPNAGDVMAAWLLGEIGDCRDKFQDASAMQALAGTCPVTIASGKRRVVQFRVGCCKPFRNATQQLARLSSIGPKASPWARGYVSDQLARGHSGSRALRALANRWLAIIFRLWKHRVAYDERVHLRSRIQHGYRLTLPEFVKQT
jgi:transposase